MDRRKHFNTVYGGNVANTVTGDVQSETGINPQKATTIVGHQRPTTIVGDQRATTIVGSQRINKVHGAKHANTIYGSSLEQTKTGFAKTGSKPSHHTVFNPVTRQPVVVLFDEGTGQFFDTERRSWTPAPNWMRGQI